MQICYTVVACRPMQLTPNTPLTPHKFNIMENALSLNPVLAKSLGEATYRTCWERGRLTTDVDFDFAEVHELGQGGKLHDEISARWHVGGARQRNNLFVDDSARALTTHVVVPQRWSSRGRRHVRQSNDETA